MALDPSNDTTAHREAFWLLCGQKLGEGIARVTYRSLLASDEVIKVEIGSGSFQNVREWEAWQEVKDTPWAKWFAPCVSISPCGIVLVQKRTTRPNQYPDRVPAFFTDLKRPNYGMYRGNFVCHDYGTSLLMQTGLTKRMRKAKWWDLEES